MGATDSSGKVATDFSGQLPPRAPSKEKGREIGKENGKEKVGERSQTKKLGSKIGERPGVARWNKEEVSVNEVNHSELPSIEGCSLSKKEVVRQREGEDKTYCRLRYKRDHTRTQCLHPNRILHTPSTTPNFHSFPVPLAVARSEEGVSGAWVAITGVQLSGANSVSKVLQDRTYGKKLHGSAAEERLQGNARTTIISQRVRPTDEEFYTRQNQCRNAILVDVLPPKPSDTSHRSILPTSWRAFWGFPSDFHVARYSERDYVVFLPEWVPSEQLLSRGIISLEDLKLQCFPWTPGATRERHS
uniref:Uncharacterized protein n=1 Tax=Ananas comosus var. bracteatus TaxID=296719 RepID=A0A6V7NH48_ANACO|nr:unnamed protein product [Ananas comosus var. bracteatus]